MKSFAIIGLGLFGAELAKDLYSKGHNVLAIDTDEASVEKIADKVSKAVVLDAKNRDSLMQLKINKYDCVIVCSSNDLATSVIVTINLKALQVPEIICKVQNETDQEVLDALGATQCIIPEHVAATKLSKILTSRHVIDFTQLSEEHGIMEMTIPKDWINKSILELGIRSQYGLNIIGIKQNDSLTVDFKPSYVLRANDELIVIGSNKNLSRIEKMD